MISRRLEATSDCDLDELDPYETSLDSWFCVGEPGSTGFGDRLESIRTRVSVAVWTDNCYTGRGRIVVTEGRLRRDVRALTR